MGLQNEGTAAPPAAGAQPGQVHTPTVQAITPIGRVNGTNETTAVNASTSIFNPNTQQGTDVANEISPFLQALFSNPQSFMQGLGGFASPLQQQAVGHMGSFLNQPAPESRALQQAQPALASLLGGQHGLFGGFSAGQQVVNAAQPVFNQNLQGALTQVANRAPSIRNSAFGDQASGLAQRALSDFNLFQQQALQQGQQLDLGAAQMAQQGQLGGLGMLGQLSSAAGQNPFARMLGAGGLGNQITQGNINPLLQLMLGGMNFGQQHPQEAIVRQRREEGPGVLDFINAGANVINAFIPG